MNCIYLKELTRKKVDIYLPENEINHIRALRIGNDETVFSTNGTGLLAFGKIKFFQKNKIAFLPSEFYENYGENSTKISLAIGILDNRDRFEFALEKAVELGIIDFYPIISAYTQKKEVNIERLNLKAIASMKQCCRSVLTKIHKPKLIEQLTNSSAEYERIILADIGGKKPVGMRSKESTLVIVGPEGGFTPEEIEMMTSDKRVFSVNLGIRRLRAETAAIVALGLLN
jgi:16S rRNA (uracil1498-N3)-methyltransferase